MDIKAIALFSSCVVLTACNSGSDGGNSNPLAEPLDNTPVADAPANDNTTTPAGVESTADADTTADESTTEEVPTSGDEPVTTETEEAGAETATPSDSDADTETDSDTESPPTGAEDNTADVTDTDPDVALTTAGQPVAGGPVDCANTLPCSGMTDDGGLTFTLSFADGTKTNGTGNFQVDFSAKATRETVVEIDRSSNVLASGQKLTDGIITFGENTERYADAVTAETPVGLWVNGAIFFNDSLSGGIDQLDQVELRLTVDGIPKRLQFNAVPAGRAPSDTADCAQTLPCTWTTPAGDVEVILSLVNNRRIAYYDGLAVAYTVSTKQRKMNVAAGSRSLGLSDQGATFSNRQMIIGDNSFTYGYATFILEAGQTVAGILHLHREATALETQISQLQLNVFEEHSPRVPYWNPVFVNVPIQ